MSEAAGNKLDSLKWLLVALLVGAGIYGNSYFSDESLLYRVIGLLVIVGAFAFLAPPKIKKLE